MTIIVTKTDKNSMLNLINLPTNIYPSIEKNEASKLINKHLRKQGFTDINKPIDGVGLQLNFDVDGKSYLLIGISRGELLSVNGGKLEANDIDLFSRLAQEYKEETFGVFNLKLKGNQIYLNCPLINQHTDYQLNFSTAHLDDNAAWGMAYLTFSVHVDGFSLQQLTSLARQLSPTAEFWNKIGNFLHENRWAAFNENEFLTKWNDSTLKQKRHDFINELRIHYKNCLDKNDEKCLFVELGDVEAFKADTFEGALTNFANFLDQLPNSKAFWKLKNETVGDYSERPSYHVVATEEMKAALQGNRNAVDVNGKSLAKVFDSKTVQALCLDQKNLFKSDEIAGCLSTSQFSKFYINEANLDLEQDQAKRVGLNF